MNIAWSQSRHRFRHGAFAARCVRQVCTGLKNPRVEYPASPWGQSLSKTNVQCFKKAVLTGAFGYVVRAAVLRRQ